MRLKFNFKRNITGNMIVEFFSEAIWVNVCKYLSCKAVGDWLRLN